MTIVGGEERAMVHAADLRLRLGGLGITLTDDARTAINRAFLAFADEGSGIGDGRGPLSRAEKDAVLSYMERHCPHRAKETAWDAVSAFNAILRRRLIAIELTQE